MPEQQTKVVSLDKIRPLISDGDIIAVGGTLSAKQPIALIREIIRQNVKGLTTVGGAHGLDIDFLCAGGAVKAVQNSFVGFEFDFGLAPNYRRLVQEKRVEMKESDCDFTMNQFRAAQYGIPFMPMPLVEGTDLLKIHPEFKTMICPYTGQKITIVPALKPDVAIIHAHYGDSSGNIKIFKPHFADLLMASIAKTTIVSVEQILPEEELRELQPELPGFHVDAVIEIPFGAHPTSCYPNYTYDREHLAHYVKLAQQGEAVFKEQYLDVFVYGVQNNDEYLELIGGPAKLEKLQSWNKSIDDWKEAFVINE